MLLLKHKLYSANQVIEIKDQEFGAHVAVWNLLQEVEDRAMWATIEWGKLHPKGLQLPSRWAPGGLEQAYLRCGNITSDYAKTFYLVRWRSLL